MLITALLLAASARISGHPRLNAIVISGQIHSLHRYPGDASEKTYKISEPVDAAHLYSVDRHGRRKQITFGKLDDFAPRYSRSLGGLLFVRSAGKRRVNQLMFLKTGTQDPAILGKIPHGDIGVSAVSESGQTYAVETGVLSDDGKGSRLAIVYRGKIVKSLPDEKFQIVPGTERVYVQADGEPFFFDPSTGKITKIPWSEDAVGWLNSEKAVAASRGQQSSSDIRIRNQKGKILGTIPITGSDIDDGMGPLLIYPQADRIHTDWTVMVNEDEISDGPHPSAYRVNLTTGDVKDLFQGGWYDTNDRGEFLSITWDWVGTYKRANHRTGFLHLTSPDGVEIDQLTKYPMDVYGACWAPG